MVALRDQESKANLRAAESRSVLIGRLRQEFRTCVFDCLLLGRNRMFRLSASLQNGVVQTTRNHHEDALGVSGKPLETAAAMEYAVEVTDEVFGALDEKLDAAAVSDWFGEVFVDLEICGGERSKPIRCGAARLAKMGSGR